MDWAQQDVDSTFDAVYTGVKLPESRLLERNDTMTETIKVTTEGVVVPRPLIAEWGDIQEVEIEQHTDAIIIRPKGQTADDLHEAIVEKMKAAGLIEELPWPHPPVIPAEQRAHLAKRLSQGKLLSEIVIEDREDRA